uniref:Uncharacterized protein n=1 Tax=Oryza rufipogon TaxID=4529 RepID=A0A0E0P371_ORYRU
MVVVCATEAAFAALHHGKASKQATGAQQQKMDWETTHRRWQFSSNSPTAGRPQPRSKGKSRADTIISQLNLQQEADQLMIESRISQSTSYTHSACKKSELEKLSGQRHQITDMHSRSTDN